MGTFQLAEYTDSPVWILNGLVGMDLASIMPWRVVVSPPTADGIVRRSRVEPC